MRVPVQGRKNFVGILQRRERRCKLNWRWTALLLSLDLAQVEKARLVPNL